MTLDDCHRGVVGIHTVMLGGQAERKLVIRGKACAGDRASSSRRHSVAPHSASVFPGI